LQSFFLAKAIQKRISIIIGAKNKKMTNPYKDKSWFKFLSNKYVWVLLFFCTWMIFLDNYSYFDHRILDQQIEDLEDNAAYYKEEIKKDKENIKQLKNPNK